MRLAVGEVLSVGEGVRHIQIRYTRVLKLIHIFISRENAQLTV